MTMKRIKALIATVLLALTMLIGSAAVAPAAEALVYGNRVALASGSTGNISVYGDIRLKNSKGQYYVVKGTRWLTPGQNTLSHRSMIHARTFKTPSKCITYRVTGALKKKYTLLKKGYTYPVQLVGTTYTVLVYC